MTSLSSPERVLRLGVSGWFNPDWQAVFYPADLPEEWRLTFFNTQFDCVFLRQMFWQRATPEQREQWMADTHEQFLFLLESDGAVPPEEMAGKALCLKADDDRILWFGADSSLKELTATLSARVPAKSTFLISQDGDFSQIERVTTLLEVLGL